MIPDGWAERRFGNVLTADMPPLDLVDEEVYGPVVVRRRHAGIEVREWRRGKDILVKKQFKAQPGTFLISRRQIVHGSCGIVPDELGDNAIISKEYVAYRGTDELDVDFLAYYAQMPEFQRTIVRTTYGVDDEKFVFKDEWWHRETLLLPPLPEQKRIAEILTSVDEAIQATEAVIEQTKKVKQGLLQELFTKGIGKDGDPGQPHTRFKQTPIGEIPESWRMKGRGVGTGKDGEWGRSNSVHERTGSGDGVIVSTI